MPRSGDIRHSLSNIKRASSEIGYVPKFDITDGLERTIRWGEEKKTV